MIVHSYFYGDDVGLGWKQHGVYGQALGIIVRRCNALARFAMRVLDDSSHPTWGTVTSFDHRVLQHTHDLLAAAWRHHAQPLQRRLPLNDEIVALTSMDRWLEWLSTETCSWVKEPDIVSAVQTVLANQNQSAGYAAEDRLHGIFVQRFPAVPWSSFLIQSELIGS